MIGIKAMSVIISNLTVSVLCVRTKFRCMTNLVMNRWLAHCWCPHWWLMILMILISMNVWLHREY